MTEEELTRRAEARVKALEDINYIVAFNEDCVDDYGNPIPIKVFLNEACPNQYKIISDSIYDLNALEYVYQNLLNEKRHIERISKDEARALNILVHSGVNVDVLLNTSNVLEYNKQVATGSEAQKFEKSLSPEEFEFVKTILRRFIL